MSLMFPVKEELAEQKEDGQFIFHILPLNSKFTDTFKSAWSQLEIFLPILCLEQKTHRNVTRAETNTALSVYRELCSSELQTEIKTGEKTEKRTGEETG